jgi:hypothetical protein
MMYVSKYVAKLEKYPLGTDDASTGFNSLPYLPGRFWGIFHKALVPYDDLVVVTLPATCSSQVFHDLRRAAQQKYKNIRRNNGGLGFFLLAADVDLWQRYVEYLLANEFSIRRAKIERRDMMRFANGT